MDPTRLLSADWLRTLGAALPPDAVIAALASAAATLALVSLFTRWPRALTAPLDANAEPGTGGAVFRIVGSAVTPVSEPARALIEDLPPASSRLTALIAHLAPDCAGIDDDLQGLVLHGSSFRTHCLRSDGSAFEVVGEPRDGAGYLSIRQPSEDASALQRARTELARASDELQFLRDVVDEAPVMAWHAAPDGTIHWANAGYRDRFDATDEALPDHRISDAFGHVLEEVPLTASGTELRRRVSVPGQGDGEPHWYELRQSPAADGGSLGFALEADDLVAAESSLRRFVETLTETFAHLPIGLAVFDKNRRLGLFNPALTDLVKIDAVWLAGRPSLRDFLERLRETRQMPEQKDFAAWRRKMGELEKGARDGTYEENWVLPSGKVFRVTGRPHPQGAVALLFEDISTAIQLERRYRSELELSQATLDRLSEAVAVFDASGTLVLANAAFESLWGLEPMHGLDGPAVSDLVTIWSETCVPSPVWERIAEFATAAEARTSWTENISLRNGRALCVAVSPLPDASALVAFRDAAADGEAAPSADLTALAFTGLQAAVEDAVGSVQGAIPSAQSPAAFKVLGEAAQTLRDALAQIRGLTHLAAADREAEEVGAVLPGLARTLATKGLRLQAPPEAAQWEPARRRTAVALVLAAAERAAEGSEVDLAFECDGESAEIVVRTRAASERAPGPAAALARRIAADGGGALRETTEGQELTLSAGLPGAAAEVRAIGA